MTWLRGPAPRFAAVVALALVLGACVSRPTRTAPPTAQEVATGEAWQRARHVALEGATRWSLSGRIAVSANGKGGSGRIDWTQDGDRFDIALGAPVTRQSWRLSGDATLARLEGLEGGPREGADAQRLLQEATGWRIPVGALRDWARGLPSTQATGGVETYGSDGRLARVTQSGWVLEFQDWHPATAERPDMPKRIFARSGDATVRLLIDEWQLVAAGPAGEAPRSGSDAVPE
ncbi:lipoprotein insertase outer membrane protein LolB [Agrilutibacter solisilvae]|uniref:Outer-membrane lipoprotein LolB n=1 Tax=Agrilutibacter solisilvae TaxID=2763317 RepID=A0A975AU54_9GAMM|nr:lipoprotein insertase outer membrane protein LolB [Lysobacter solisilvae]QSX79825.1 outer membrane lipoprotein LolB [Lysobacter solisilvae]